MTKSNISNWEKIGKNEILTLSNGKENYLIEPEFVKLTDLQKWTDDTELKGVIIRGLGRNFSAGASINDLINLARDNSQLSQKIEAGKQILDFIEDLNIPVVASINGVCFGGGLEIALACHMRIASENALFAFPETNLGLIPGLGGIYRITQLLGNHYVYELVLEADMLNATNAKEIGLIDYISETKDAFELSHFKIKNLTNDRSKEVICSAMQAIRNAETMNRVDALKIETELFCKLALKIKIHQQE